MHRNTMKKVFYTIIKKKIIFFDCEQQLFDIVGLKFESNVGKSFTFFWTKHILFFTVRFNNGAYLNRFGDIYSFSSDFSPFSHQNSLVANRQAVEVASYTDDD